MGRYNRIMLILTVKTRFEAWLMLALKLTGDQGTVHVRVLVDVPPDTSPSEYANQAQQWRTALDLIIRRHHEIDDDLRVYVECEPLSRVVEDIAENGIELALIQWPGPLALTGGMTTNTLLSRLPCDVVLLHGETWTQEGAVLLSLRGGPNLTLGIQMARALCGDSEITLFHAADPRHDVPDLEVVMRAELAIARTITARTGITTGILAEAETHKAIVMGSGLYRPETSEYPRRSVIEDVFRSTDRAIALVRTYRPESITFHAPYRVYAAERDISTRTDRWFAENTFHSAEFEDVDSLVSLKEKRGVTISLGLPALNEEETVENVIRTLKSALLDDVPLLDEIVLIDSDSTDNTVPLALACGIPVYKHPDILSHLGSVRGKGEALWKSLHVLKGDIVVWVDTDITNIHPRFVYGLVGPLLKHPRIQYTKGFYQRPIQVGEKIQAYGGGRVTELVARPMFNLFYPELSGLIQPLAGEYAGRREALERVPFFTGYGVETGLLIDLFDLYGLDGLAQVDLEMRVHHNQPLVNLSKMAFAILQVFMTRLSSKTGAQLLELANQSMKLVVHDPDRFALEVETIRDQERPPMITIHR